MKKTWFGIGGALMVIGVFLYVGSGRTFTTPTPEPMTNPLIVASTTSDTTPPPPTTQQPSEQPTIPRSAFNKKLVFNNGYQKVFTTGLIVTMTDLADSRCKPDVQCIWAGEVSVSLTIVGGGVQPSQTIILGSVTKTHLTVGGYLFTLVAADETSATIIVSETADNASTSATIDVSTIQ